MNRRDFLRGSSLSAGAVALSPGLLLQIPTTTNLSLDDFSLGLGDATWGCPPVIADNYDVSKDSNHVYANVNKKAAQVHAFATYKRYQPIDTISYELNFLLPYQPNADIRQERDPQTIEANASIWRGDSRILYEVGIQWVINPWDQNVVNAWLNGAWQQVLRLQINPNQWYKFILDLNNNDAAKSQVALYCKWFCWWISVGKWTSYSARSKLEWGDDLSYWVTCETISCSPNCNTGIGFKHYAAFAPIKLSTS